MEVINLKESEEKQDSIVEKKEPAEIVEKPVEDVPVMTKMASVAVGKIEKNLMEQAQENTDFKEGGKNIAHIMMTAEAMNNADEDNQAFLKDIKEQKQKELKQSFLSERFKEEAKKYAAKQQKAEAFYTNVRPILEFDFSPLIPKNAKTSLWKRKPKYDKRGNVINDGQDNKPSESTVEERKPTYQDRSYGIPLMILMLFLLTIPYCLITVVLAIGNGINAIFNGIARFGKPALIICGSIVGIAICLLAVYSMLKGVDLLFGTGILNSILKK